MSETSARLLTLLSLLQARRDWPGEALADRLQVSPRTVRRDVDRLRDLGYPVRATKGPDGGYRLDAGSELPPLLFDDEQAVAVAVALQTATSSVTGIEEGALRALATVRQVMPARLRQRVDALQVTTVERAGRELPRVDTEHLIAVGTAVRAREVLRFDYVTGAEWWAAQEGGEVAEPDWRPPRRVEPHHLVTWGGRWYLVAWDLVRDHWRTFRVDRMVPKTPTGPRFSPRDLPTGDVASFISRQFTGPWSEWPCEGEVVLHIGAEEVPSWIHKQGILEAIGPDRCRLVVGSWSWERLATWLGMFDLDLEVVGPAELRDAVSSLARRYSAAVAG